MQRFFYLILRNTIVQFLVYDVHIFFDALEVFQFFKNTLNLLFLFFSYIGRRVPPSDICLGDFRTRWRNCLYFDRFATSERLDH